MDIDTTYDHQNQIRVHQFAGAVTADAIKAFMQQLITTPDSHVDYDALWDFSDASLDFDKEQFSDLVRWILNTLDKPLSGKLALIFEGEFGFALGRMYQGYTTDHLRTTKIFLDRDQAMAWLLETGDTAS